MKVSTKNLVWFIYLFTALYSYSKFTEIVSFLSIIKYIQLGLTVILLLSSITHSISPKRLFFMVFLLGASIIEMNVIGDVSVMFYITFILCVKNLNCAEMVKKNLWFKSIFILLVVASCMAGLIDNYTMIRTDGSIRYSLGFNHPNTFAGLVISVLLEWMCLQTQKSLRVRHIIAVVLVVLLVDRLTNSRTYEFSMIITLFLTFVFLKADKDNKLFRIGFIAMPVVFTAISFGLVLMYDGGNPNWVMLDTVVSNRISFARNFILQYSLQMWGQNMNLVGSVQALFTSENTHILDMGYLRFILQYGLIFSILLLAILMIDLHYAVKTKNTTMFVLLTYLCVSALFESTFGNPIYNYIIPVVTAGVLSSIRQDRMMKIYSIDLG